MDELELIYSNVRAQTCALYDPTTDTSSYIQEITWPTKMGGLHFYVEDLSGAN